MMPTNEQSTIIAVFVTRDQANQAIDNLRHAGFSYEQIRLVEHGTNSFVETLKSLFTGQTTATNTGLQALIDGARKEGTLTLTFGEGPLGGGEGANKDITSWE